MDPEEFKDLIENWKELKNKISDLSSLNHDQIYLFLNDISLSLDDIFRLNINLSLDHLLGYNFKEEEVLNVAEKMGYQIEEVFKKAIEKDNVPVILVILKNKPSFIKTFEPLHLVYGFSNDRPFIMSLIEEYIDLNKPINMRTLNLVDETKNIEASLIDALICTEKEDNEFYRLISKYTHLINLNLLLIYFIRQINLTRAKFLVGLGANLNGFKATSTLDIQKLRDTKNIKEFLEFLWANLDSDELFYFLKPMINSEQNISMKVMALITYQLIERGYQKEVGELL